MTFVAGSVLTAAQLNVYLRDNTNALRSGDINAVAQVLTRDVTVFNNAGSAENTFFTTTVAAAALGTDRQLRVTAIGQLSDFGGTYTFKGTYGGSTFGIAQYGAGGSSHVLRAFMLQAFLSAKNSATAQGGVVSLQVGQDVGDGGTATSGALIVGSHMALAVDSAAAQTLALTIKQDTSSGDQVTNIHAVVLELLN